MAHTLGVSIPLPKPPTPWTAAWRIFRAWPVFGRAAESVWLWLKIRVARRKFSTFHPGPRPGAFSSEIGDVGGPLVFDQFPRHEGEWKGGWNFVFVSRSNPRGSRTDSNEREMPLEMSPQ